MALIFRGFPELLRHLRAIGSPASTLIPTKLQVAANGLFEVLLQAPAPGSQQLLVIGHDHGEGGGVPLSRGQLYCWDDGDDNARHLKTLDNTAGNLYDTWYEITGREYTFGAWVSPGVDSNNDSESSAPCALEARLLVDTYNPSGTASPRLRVSNLTTQTTSSELLLGSGVRQELITTIPCKEGVRNLFNVEIKASANATVRVLAFNLAETKGTSQPASAGSTAYSSVARPL